MGNSKKKAVAATKVRPSAPLAAPAGDTLDARVNKWIELRCQRAFSVVAYTPATDLQKDFAAWHEAEYPDQALPSDAAFVSSLTTAYKIRVERLPIKVPFEKERVGLCVNLTLLHALRSAA